MAVFATGIAMHAQTSMTASAIDGVSAKLEKVRNETTRLLIGDAKRILESNAPRGADRPAGGSEIVVMSPFIVRDRKLPKVIVTPKETPAIRYLRTGKLYESVGKKGTKTLSLQDAPGPHGFGELNIAFRISW